MHIKNSSEAPKMLFGIVAALFICALPILSSIGPMNSGQVAPTGDLDNEFPGQYGSPTAPPERDLDSPRFRAGTVLQVRLLQSVGQSSTEEVQAELTSQLTWQGKIVFPRGTRLHGHVEFSKKEGNPSYAGLLSLQLDEIQTIDGRWIDIKTTPVLAKIRLSKRKPVSVESPSSHNSSGAPLAESAPESGGEGGFSFGRKVTFALTQELTVPK